MLLVRRNGRSAQATRRTQETQSTLRLEDRDSNGALDGILDVLHERGTDHAGEGTAKEKGFVESSDLLAFGRGSFVEAAFSSG